MIDYMNASDEDILNAVAPEVSTETETTEETTDEVTAEETSVEEEVTTEEPEDSPEESTEVTSEEVTEEAEESDSDTDAKEQLAKIFAPFRANGKEIKVDNVDDVIRLMQMGAGFNKKMAGLKPQLKLLKMLENNDLLSEEKISLMIDINKKDPAAIGKLLADSEIDPLNLDLGNEYTPKSYTVSDSELELDDVLSDLRDSPHYAKTLDVTVNKWDSTSKQLLISNPSVIRILHDQIGNGIFDQVTQMVEKERLFGRLNRLSDLEAYKQIGDMMDAKGLFKHSVQQTKATPPVAGKPTVNESELKSKKLAASPTKTSPGKKQDLSKFNPLALTDEEIMNMSLDKFL